jgi:nucleoside-diphosphate-sugar epimerase
MRTLVTGGAGFIGSTLVDALLARGDDVVVVDDLSTGRESNLDGALRNGAELVRADIREAERLEQIVVDARPETIFHLAAQIDVRKSIGEPGWDASINVVGTANVLESARKAGVARFVNTSTGGAIYGDVDTIPSPETTRPAPMAGYGTSKFCAEQYCNLYARLHGLRTLTLRYGNVYGPRQDPLGEAGVARFVNTSTGGAIYGDVDTIPSPESTRPAPMAGYGTSKFCAEQYCNLYARLHGLRTVTLRYGNVYGPRQDPLGEAGVIAIFCGRLMDGGRPTIYGDGAQTRDYVYVGDVVEANLAAADRPGVGGEVNIGTGRETSVLDLVQILQQEGDRDDFEADLAPARIGEIERSCLDVTRAREELGWTARTSLADGMRATLDAARLELSS